MEIVEAFLLEYEITDDHDEFVANTEINKFISNYRTTLSSFNKRLHDYCDDHDLPYEPGRKHVGRGLWYIKKRETPLEPKPKPKPKPEPEPEPEPIKLKFIELSELDEQFAAFTNYKIYEPTLDVFCNDKRVCWISFDPEEEFIILQQDSHKELLLKDVLRDYIETTDTNPTE